MHLHSVHCDRSTAQPDQRTVQVVYCVSQVFGKTMMCKDVDVANRIAHRDNLDGITMEGTQVSKKGVYKGGFHDVSRSAIQTKKRKLVDML